MSGDGRRIVYPGYTETAPNYTDHRNANGRRGSRTSDAGRDVTRTDDRRHHRSRDRDRERDNNEDRTRTSHRGDNSRRHSVNRTPVIVQPSPNGHHAHSRYDDDRGDEYDRYVVPALPLPIAVICCVLNFMVPGVGSMTAAMCVLCCANTDDMTCGEKCGSCLTVFGIGLLQLLLVVCFLIGWIWSCIWGITFIGMSLNYYRDDYDEEQTSPLERRHRGRTPLPTPEVVPNQPYPGIGYDELNRQQERSRRSRERHRRARSRISLSSSNLIYPMRAPSNIQYNSPPPPYPGDSPPPGYRSRDPRLGTAASSTYTLQTLPEAPMESSDFRNNHMEGISQSPTVPIETNRTARITPTIRHFSLDQV